MASKISVDVSLLDSYREIIPSNFFDPISFKPITVALMHAKGKESCGKSFQEAELLKWLKINSTCPNCRARVSSSDFVRNRDLEGALETFASVTLKRFDEMRKNEKALKYYKKAKELFKKYDSESFKLACMYVNKGLSLNSKNRIKLTNLLASSIKRSNTNPLIFAAENCYLEIVKYLKENGVDLNAKNDEGQTALIRAVLKGHLVIVKYLIENGADLNEKSNIGKTALMYAAYCGNLEIVRYLKENRADLNAKNNKGGTALTYTALKNYIIITKYLKENGADLNAKNNRGETTLMLAASKGHLEIV
nr:Phosphocholine transferase AnkX [Candidatus Anoxychlamydiales bacterium]